MQTVNISLVYPPARKRAFLVTAGYLSVAVIGTDPAIASTVFYPPPDCFTRPFSVASTKAGKECRWETLRGSDVVRAERRNTCFLWFCQRHLDISFYSRPTLYRVRWCLPGHISPGSTSCPSLQAYHQPSWHRGKSSIFHRHPGTLSGCFLFLIEKLVENH